MSDYLTHAFGVFDTQLALDEDGQFVRIENADPDETYSCPSCKARLFPCALEENYCRSYFRHSHNTCKAKSVLPKIMPKKLKDNKPVFPPKGSNEGAWHKGMKAIALEHGAQLECSQTNSNGTEHRCDVRIGNIVFEFQHSDISPMDFWNRTIFWKKQGCYVVWIFDQVGKGKVSDNKDHILLRNYWTCLESFVAKGGVIGKSPDFKVSRCEAYCENVSVHFDVSPKGCGEKIVSLFRFDEDIRKLAPRGAAFKDSDYRTFEELIEIVEQHSTKSFSLHGTKPLVSHIEYRIWCNAISDLATFDYYVEGRSRDGFFSYSSSDLLYDGLSNKWSDLDHLGLHEYLRNIDPIFLLGDNTFNELSYYEKGSNYMIYPIEDYLRNELVDFNNHSSEITILNDLKYSGLDVWLKDRSDY